MNNSDRFWRRKGREVAGRINLGWWLDGFLPALIVLSAVLACLLLLARRAGIDESWFWAGYGAALGVVGMIRILRIRRRWFSAEDGLVRLDIVMGLHSRLVSASKGVTSWPDKKPSADGGLRWRWERIGGALGLSMALLFLAAWIPIQRDAVEVRRSPEEPLAWTQVEAWLDGLEAEQVAEQEGIENFREQLEELRKQSAEKWYSHGSLEAGDSLRQKTEQSIESLERYQEQVSEALAAAQEMGDRMTASELEKLDARFKEGLQGLEMGALPLNKDLMSQLKDVDFQNMKRLSADQMARLQKKLEQGQLACSKSLGKTGDWDKNLKEGLLAGMQQRRTSPGIDRGPGTVPLVLKDEKSDAGSTKMEAVSNDDMSRATLGDPLAITQGEHSVDPSQDRGPVEGGGVASTGGGGDAVWKDDSLTPEERNVLKRYFK